MASEVILAGERLLVSCAVRVVTEVRFSYFRGAVDVLIVSVKSSGSLERRSFGTGRMWILTRVLVLNKDSNKREQVPSAVELFGPYAGRSRYTLAGVAGVTGYPLTSSK